jgi:hypothetical protein
LYHIEYKQVGEMIIIDFNQICISNLYAQIGNHTNVEIEPDLLRHMVLNMIRGLRSKFKDEYGEIIIACDDRNYWRKEIYPYYKINRKKAREASDMDWNKVFDAFNSIRSELKQFFPYRVIQVEHAEADDIIATLAYEYGIQLVTSSDEKIMILSGDKDFIQLQKFANVEQFDPVKKRNITSNDPEQYLFEHILKGDAGDGVPNVLSNDDVFVVRSRQKPLTKKTVDKLSTTPKSEWDAVVARNFARNKAMIDLSCIPDNIKQQILDKYDEESGKDRSQLFKYFIEYKLKNLTEHIGDF